MLATALTILALSAGPAEAAGSPFRDLGEQFVIAIRNKDIVEYSQCWISFRRLRAIAQSAGNPVPEKQLAAMRGYFETRNQHVAHSLKVLTETFASQGDLAQLTLVEIGGRVDEKRGIRRTSMFQIVVSLGSDKYEITIDDGFEDAGSWYFSDKPLQLENLATHKAVSLQEPKESGAK